MSIVCHLSCNPISNGTHAGLSQWMNDLGPIQTDSTLETPKGAKKIHIFCYCIKLHRPMLRHNKPLLFKSVLNRFWLRPPNSQRRSFCVVWWSWFGARAPSKSASELRPSLLPYSTYSGTRTHWAIISIADGRCWIWLPLNENELLSHPAAKNGRILLPLGVKHAASFTDYGRIFSDK